MLRAEAITTGQAQYRLYEVQNGNHIESFVGFLPAIGGDPAARTKGFRLARGPCGGTIAASSEPVRTQGRDDLPEPSWNRAIAAGLFVP